METIVSTFVATIGSTAAVLLVEIIKNKWLDPLKEFKRLRQKVNSTLSMNACYFSNVAEI